MAPLPDPGFHFPSARAAAAATYRPHAASGVHGRDALGARGSAPGLRLQLQQLPAHGRCLSAFLLGCRLLPFRHLGPSPPAVVARGRRSRRLPDAGPSDQALACAHREAGGAVPCGRFCRCGGCRLIPGPSSPFAFAVAGGGRGPDAGLQPGTWCREGPRAGPFPGRAHVSLRPSVCVSCTRPEEPRHPPHIRPHLRPPSPPIGPWNKGRFPWPRVFSLFCSLESGRLGSVNCGWG